MSNLGFADFEPVMKTHYLDGLNDNSNRATVLLKHMQRNSEAVSGNFAQLALLRRGNPGIGSRGDGATLPTANFSKHEKATFGMKTLYGRGRISGKTQRASTGGGVSAFAEALDTQLQSLLRDLPADHNRQLFGDGTGSLTGCAATTNSTTVNVVSTQYIKEDDVLDIRDRTAGTAVSAGTAVTVLTVPSDTTFTVSAAVTTSTTDHVFLMDSRLQEIYGLQNTHSASNPPSPVPNYGGIDRTAAGKKFWQASVLSNSGTNRALTRGLMQQALMKSHTVGNGNINFIICNPDVWITYGNLLAPDQRFSEQIYEIDGGFEALKFVRTPVVFDKDCPNNQMYFNDMDALMLFEYESGYQWMEADGSVLRYVVDQDIIEFTLLKDAELGSSACNRQVLLDDIKTNLN